MSIKDDKRNSFLPPNKGNYMPAKSTKPGTGKPKVKKPVTQKRSVAKVFKPERTDVFVSYSHDDKKWLTRLQVHLKPLERDHNITIWADTKLRGGDQWRTEIENALAKAKVAILLVSADFMASSFIATDELPPLLLASRKEGVLILPVVVGASGGFADSNLSQFQSLNDPVLPLNRMAEGQPDEVFRQLYDRVRDAFKKPAVKTTTFGRFPTKSVEAASAKLVASKSTVSVATRTPAAKTPSTPRKVNKALLVKQSGEWSAVTVVRAELTEDLRIVLAATDASQKAFLTSLTRQATFLGSIVLNGDTYVCRNTEVHVKTEGTKETWHLKTAPQQTNRRAEITYSGISPNAIAEARTRLLLLNEPTPTDQSYGRHFGSNLTMDFDSSPLPTLYHQLKKQTTAFNQIAPLIITWYLQINNLAEHILKLTFSLKGSQLTIRFSGQRGNQFQHDSPATIKVEGTCDVSKSSGDDILLLGPISRY